MLSLSFLLDICSAILDKIPVAGTLKIEKTNIFQILGVSCSFIGVVLIITKANLEILVNLDFNKGDITMVFGMLSWATYLVLLKK